MSEGFYPQESFLMGPCYQRLKACAGYAESTGNPALITDVDHLKEALEGRDGTRITG